MPNPQAIPQIGGTPPGRSDVADFAYFLAIARHRSFRGAGLELSVNTSGLSHALKRLEARLGVLLINRADPGATLTEAGEELCEAIGQPFEQIAQVESHLSL